MIIIPGRIPIFIHPFFWILAAVIGLLYGGFSVFALIWVAIVFISVLFHEMGHAITALVFGQHPQVSLVALGGLTTYEGKGLNFFQQFIIVLNGPIFGIALFLLSYQIISYEVFQNAYLIYFFSAMWKINLFWSAINLLPVLPLDGGQLIRIVFEAIFGEKGFRASIFVGMVVAFALSIISFIFFTQLLIVGIIFFLFAFQNFELFRKSRFISKSDRDDENREEMGLAEKALQEGNKEEAKKHLHAIKEKGTKGLLNTAAVQYLALMEFQEGRRKEAYELLLSIEDQLSGEPQLILHELSFEFENYELVSKLSQNCFQMFPSQKVALTNARAFAYLNQPRPAGGWLQTALEFGKLDLTKILQENAFQNIMKDPAFKEFVPDDIDKN